MILPKRLSLPVSEAVGTVSALLLLPEDAFALLVLSHGAGAGMEHAFMEQLAQALAAQKVGTLRFNFAYMEKGGGAPDRPEKAYAVIKAAVQEALKHAKGLTLLAGGKSFGGRMTSQMAANGALEEVQGIVYVGFPLHAAGKPDTKRAAHLAAIKQPQLFLQGTRDTLAEIDLIKEVCNNLAQAHLVIIEGADHSFKLLKSAGMTHEQAIQRLAEETADFARRLRE